MSLSFPNQNATAELHLAEQLHSSRLLEAHENRELRAKVSKLSKELAALLKERNVLLHAVHGSTEHEVMCMHSSSMPHAVEEKLSGAKCKSVCTQQLYPAVTIQQPAGFAWILVSSE